jgi:phosphatidylserine decarboxylase
MPGPFAPGAFKYAGLALLAGIPASLVSPLVGIPLLAGSLGVLYFYRDPARKPPASGVVAPADGTVSVLRWEDDPEGRRRIRVGIYLGPRDVHVIRAPFGGPVRAVDRESGGHWPAQLGRADRNEKVHVRFDGATVTMIVGVFARRIVPYAEAGRRVRRGERIGHIAFGSRTDVLLPAGVGPADLEVEPGEAVRAGETVLVDADAVDRADAETGGLRLDGPDDDGVPA